jgi:hypothetical protein
MMPLRIEVPDGSVTVLDERGGLLLAVSSAGVVLTLRLPPDDARQLVAVLERELRARAAHRLDPAALCRCGHRRGVHQDQEGACRDNSACPCLVMRPESVLASVQSCTVAQRPRVPDQRVRSFEPYSEPGPWAEDGVPLP